MGRTRRLAVGGRTLALAVGLGPGLTAQEAPVGGVRRIVTGEETEVLVVATVHAQHQRNPNYTYEDVVHILDTFQPDVVCVEIRPEGFRREPYLKEMMLATVWGLVHDRTVCGFDWFDGTARDTRRQLEETPEYVEKARLLDSLSATNPIIRPFDERYGDFWRGEMDYRFYNGLAYNRYIEEAYRLSLAVYGDDPVNLFYESRNRRMMDQAWEVISRHPGARVALLTGAEHKHYFDRDLGAREGVDVVVMDDLLPLERPPMHPVIRAFLEDEDDLPYYEEGFPRDTARYYAGKITSLIHGPDMDWRPDIIPDRNVHVAGKVLARWRAAQPASRRLTFDEAWFNLLAGDCQAAVQQLSGLAQAVERGEVESSFVRIYTYRNLGLCQDLLGNREDALRAYARVRALAEGTQSERTIDLMLRDYETTPYARGRAREPFGR